MYFNQWRKILIDGNGLYIYHFWKYPKPCIEIHTVNFKHKNTF